MIPHFNLPELIQTAGYLGLFFIVFAESGLFFGFFLPGDSLLFTAGFIASQGLLNIWIIIGLLIVAAISGDSVGYWMGGKFGGWLLKKEDNFFFKKRYLLEAQDFYEQHGGKAIVLARFIPIIRTFAPIVAGMANMKYSRFISFNVIGGVFWVLAMTLLLGFFLGQVIPDVDKYIIPIIIGIIAISVIPPILHLRKKPTDFSFWFRFKVFCLKLIGRSTDK